MFPSYNGQCLPTQGDLYQIMPWLNPEYRKQQEKLEHEKFYRSCVRAWLDAMIDIELGVSK